MEVLILCRAVLTYQNREDSIAALEGDYASTDMGDRYAFRRMLQKYTQDHHILVIDQTGEYYGFQSPGCSSLL
jgi:hypothetical protein